MNSISKYVVPELHNNLGVLSDDLKHVDVMFIYCSLSEMYFFLMDSPLLVGLICQPLL